MSIKSINGGGPSKVQGGWKKIEKLTSGEGDVYLAPESTGKDNKRVSCIHSTWNTYTLVSVN